MLPKEILPKRSTTKGEYCYYRMYVLFADRVSGKKLAYYSCHPDDFMDAAFTAWTKLIQQYGRPQTLYLSRPEAVGLFQYFANKVSVKVKAIPHNSKCRYGERGAAAAGAVLKP